jgi:O-antigen ligase
MAAAAFFLAAVVVADAPVAFLALEDEGALEDLFALEDDDALLEGALGLWLFALEDEDTLV